MKDIVRNVIAVIAGIFIGGVVNMILVSIGPSVIPLPEGADITTTEGLQASIGSFSPMNFLFPFLGHALGTLVGAFAAAKIAVSQQMKISIGIGVFFLLGGITAVYLFGGPVWFAILDLVLAYIPMGYLGGVLARGKTTQAN